MNAVYFIVAKTILFLRTVWIAFAELILIPGATDLTVETMGMLNHRAALSQATWAGLQALPGLADDMGKVFILPVPQSVCSKDEVIL